MHNHYEESWLVPLVLQWYFVQSGPKMSTRIGHEPVASQKLVLCYSEYHSVMKAKQRVTLAAVFHFQAATVKLTMRAREGGQSVFHFFPFCIAALSVLAADGGTHLLTSRQTTSQFLRKCMSTTRCGRMLVGLYVCCEAFEAHHCFTSCLRV